MEGKSIKGTKTEQNLLKAFAGESQAKNRYTYFAKKAREDGYEQIASIFEETARQEETHAKIFFKFLEGGMVEITATYPAGTISSTLENLEASAGGEQEEWESVYPEFARIAEEEGFKKIATKFKLIGKVEAEHEKRYRAVLENMKNEMTFTRKEPVRWYCRKCGHVHEGLTAPKNCPTCEHPQSWFEVKNENY